MVHLDRQMQAWSSRLRDDLKIGPPENNQLATTIAKEVASLSEEAKQRLRDASEISLATRIEELIGFQGFMDHVRKHDASAAVVRAQVVYQNYICFVYLGESCFTVLRKELPSGSITRKCCQFLTDNPVRAFRNAVAHANWRYLPDFSGLEFWARKGAEPTEPMARFEVSKRDLGFWQALARATAYAAFLSV
jgi:hypothetical protein